MLKMTSKADITQGILNKSLTVKSHVSEVRWHGSNLAIRRLPHLLTSELTVLLRARSDSIKICFSIGEKDAVWICHDSLGLYLCAIDGI